MASGNEPHAKGSAPQRGHLLRHLDVYLLRLFAGPFVITFLLTLFVLIMQFLWKYVEDLAGKGLPWWVVGEFLLYATAATMVPLALPLATLLASMMTVGTLAENQELTALKTSGISLWRVLRPLMGLALLISAGALAFANYVVPVAFLRFGALYYDISHQRPSFNIKPGVFYREIEGYSIRIGSKGSDGETISDVLVYDHTEGKANESVVSARHGRMQATPDGRYLVLELYDGYQYRELTASTRSMKENEHVRIHFESWRKVFDLSDFALTRTDASLFKESYQMQNLRQLSASIDTMRMELASDLNEARVFARPYLAFMRTNLDSLYRHRDASRLPVARQPNDTLAVVMKAVTTARNLKGYLDYMARAHEGKGELLRRYQNERQRKFTLSFACFLLFLIGAPLGAIIRKGGFGLPFVVSVFFFILYYILSVAGEKMAREGVLTPMAGMWFSAVIVLPLAFFLVYKANNDSAVLQLDAYQRLWRRVTQAIPAFRA
ncbi:MAG: LptF/LptG family permease [Chitinophagales bacterium]|nr:LptF/LptG family permease [Chitinophagales bacterium]MDW8392728.1 LptF/LptG family permease [Chitinophagales bacterium]